MSDRNSNNIVIDRSKCVFCGLCAERCSMDHIRLQLSPCRMACPLGQNCQAYIQQIARGQIDRALSTILETNPLPGVLGRVCHRPCESACARTQVDGKPVAIRNLKRAMADSNSRPETQPPKQVRQDRVAVIGSGPAGLMAGWELNRRGYQVIIYEKDLNPGGNLTKVIPDFRLPIDIALRDINSLRVAGIKFNLGIEIGKDIALKELRAQHDAVVIASGCGTSIRLDIPGEDSFNVFSGLEFLVAVKEGKPPALGDSVVVIGGGNSSVDAAQAAKRLGVQSVRMVCLEKRDEMPAHNYCLEDALEEGVVLQNGWGPYSFATLGNRASAVKCRLCLCVWKDQCFRPELDCEIERAFAADSFIVAIGDRPDTSFLKAIGITKESPFWAKADPVTLETSISGVFAAGDVSSGASSVVQAMASGKQAAVSVDRYIRGEDLRYGREYFGPVLTNFAIPTENAEPYSRQSYPKLDATARVGMAETEQKMDANQARTESLRCLSCGVPVGYHATCWYCLPCEVSCPEQALRLEVPYSIR